MATIRTSIMVNDGLSSSLRHMNNAMSSLVTSFEHMQTAAGRPVDADMFDAFRREAALASQSLDEFEQAVDDAGNSQSNANQQLNNGANAFRNLTGGILGAVGAYLSLQQLSKLVEFSDAYANSTARIAMMNDGLQTTAELQGMIYDAAQRSYASYDDMAAMVTKLGNNAASAFSGAKEVVDFAELVQKQFSIAGTSAIEASNAALQLTQALGSGVLRGDELNSIFEQAPNIIQNIAKYLEVPIGQIRSMAKEGELTADIVKAAMFAASDDINNKFNSMPTTWSGIWTQMVNYAQNKAAGLAQRINAFFNGDTIQFFSMVATKAIDAVVIGLNFLIMTLSGLANWVATVGQFFIDNWSWIAPILLPIAVVLGAIVGILITKYTILGLVRVATLAWAAAQWVVNTAYLANPITWVLIAIVAAIALIIYMLVVWAEQTATVIGFINGLFFVLFAFIWNSVANTANAFLSFAEFLINIFIDPTYAIKKLFYDMIKIVLQNMESLGMNIDKVANAIGNAFVDAANIAIGAINWIITALNKIDGINIKTTGKLSYSGSGVGNYLKGISNGLYEPTSDKPVVNLPRLDLINYGDAYNAGFDWGYSGSMGMSDALSGLLDKVKGLTDFGGGSGSNPLGDLLTGNGLGKDDYGGLNDSLNGIKDAVKDGNGAAKDTAKNTGKLADTADLTKDELAYLREQLAENIINNFNKQNIKLEMNNENHISNDMDIDGIVDRFGEKIEEVAENLSEAG